MLSSNASSTQGQGYVPRVAILAQQKAAVRNAEREIERQAKPPAESKAGSLARKLPRSGGTGQGPVKKELTPIRCRIRSEGKPVQRNGQAAEIERHGVRVPLP